MAAIAKPGKLTGHCAERDAYLQPGDPPNLCTVISAADGMYQPPDTKHYFAVGRSALNAIRRALAACGRPDPATILDLPCGHGRVTRYLRAAYPAARITACDLLRDGVDFCAEMYGAKPVYSSTNLDAIPLKGQYDLIWCGSLFTHLKMAGWDGFLKLFSRVLRPSGVCLFTVHGNYVATCMTDLKWGYGVPDQAGLVAEWKRTGFAYRSYDGDPDYGVSLSHVTWVSERVRGVRGLNWFAHDERGWDNHQDVVTVQKSARTRFGWLKSLVRFQ